MGHPTNIVHPAGPEGPHAFTNVPLHPRNGMLDERCPQCRGHGQWNSEIDLVSFRCKRAICDLCLGNGWIETGTDPIAVADITLSPQGHPQWVTHYIPAKDAQRWQDRP